MEMERIDIESATAEQLRVFGSQNLGLEIEGRENKATMKAKFAEVGYNMDFITMSPSAPVPTGGPDRQASAFNRRPGHNSFDKDEVKIIIHTQDKPGGDRDVPVRVNGNNMLIPRGKEVWVPEPYIEALSHAIEDVYPEYSEGLGGLDKPREVLSYPFSYA